MEQAAQLYLLKEKQLNQAKVLCQLIKVCKNYEFKLKDADEVKSECSSSEEDESKQLEETYNIRRSPFYQQ